MPHNTINLALKYYENQSGELILKYALSQKHSTEPDAVKEKTSGQAVAQNKSYVFNFIRLIVEFMVMPTEKVEALYSEMTKALSSPEVGASYSMCYDESEATMTTLDDTAVTALLGDG